MKSHLTVDEASLAKAKDELAKAEQDKASADNVAKDAADRLNDAQRAYDGTVAALNAAKAELSQYQEKAKLGSAGFFQEVGADLAYKFVTEPEKSSGVADTNTHLGQTGDATSLENMKKALELMGKINEIRRANGQEELKVLDSLVAIGQVQANYGAKNFDHMGWADGYKWDTVWSVGENLAWGYPDPFKGWYHEEKALFDKAAAALYGKTGLVGDDAYRLYHAHAVEIDNYIRNLDPTETVGHYIAVIAPYNTYYGCGYVNGYPTCEQAFGDAAIQKRTGETAYTAGDYYARFMTYYNKVNGKVDQKLYDNVDKALKDLNDMKALKAQVDADAVQKAQAVTDATTNVKYAEKAVKSDKALIAQGETNAAQANQAKTDAQTAASAAKQTATEKQTIATKAAETAKADAKAAEDARAKADDAAAALKAAEQELTAAKDHLDQVSSDQLKAARDRVARAEAGVSKAQADKDAADKTAEAADAAASASKGAAGDAKDAADAADLALDNAKGDLAKAESADKAAQDALAPIQAAKDATDAAQAAADKAMSELNAAQIAAQDAQSAKDAADKAAEDAEAELAKAEERAEHLGIYADPTARTAATAEQAFEDGTFGDEWISANAPELEALVAAKKAAYDKALAAKAKAEADLEKATADLAEKQAAYDKAATALAKAEAELAEAQLWYDRMHPEEKKTEGETKQVDDKIAGAKHAKADNAAAGETKLAQTGDTDEVFWIGGIAFVAAGAAAAGAAMKRRRELQQ